jgi:hypothetical protein
MSESLGGKQGSKYLGLMAGANKHIDSLVGCVGALNTLQRVQVADSLVEVAIAGRGNGLKVTNAEQ